MQDIHDIEWLANEKNLDGDDWNDVSPPSDRQAPATAEHKVDKCDVGVTTNGKALFEFFL